MTSLRQKLHNKILTEGHVSYGAMCQFTVEEGYKVSTAERRLRELHEDNLISLEWATSKRNTRYISAYLAGGRKPQPKTTHTPVFIEKDGQVVVRLVDRKINV